MNPIPRERWRLPKGRRRLSKRQQDLAITVAAELQSVGRAHRHWHTNETGRRIDDGRYRQIFRVQARQTIVVPRTAGVQSAPPRSRQLAPELSARSLGAEQPASGSNLSSGDVTTTEEDLHQEICGQALKVRVGTAFGGKRPLYGCLQRPQQL